MLLLLACAAPPSETLTGTERPDLRDTEVLLDSGGDVDDALIVEADFPSSLDCGEAATATLRVRNAGTTTWSREEGYKLGAVDDSDPLKPGDARVWLGEGQEVLPGEEVVFEVPLLAPDHEDSLLSDWRMVRENVAWFGQVSSATVTVSCEAGTDPLPLPDMSEVVLQVHEANPGLIAQSCIQDGGNWGFMDAVVDELRKSDERWGYNGKRGDVNDPSQDVVDYHWGQGEREGSTEVYLIDMIVGHCGEDPQPGWLDQTQATADAGTIGRWTGRGRF